MQLVPSAIVTVGVLLIGTHVAPAAPPMRLELPAASDPTAKALQERIYRVAEKLGRNLREGVHPWGDDADLLLVGESKSGEACMRVNAGIVEGLSFLYRFGPYEEKVVGVSRETLLKKTILPMMRYCVATHVTGGRATDDGKSWGDQWQSAHWAQMLGNAAWWIWDDLPTDLQENVRRLIAHEADRFVSLDPPHQLHDDTKSEENAWNCQILSTASVLMPDDPRRADWDKAFEPWALSAFLRPADEHGAEVVDGCPVSKRFTGANILDDYTLENHKIVHPDYMTCFNLTLGCALHYRLTGRQAPDAILYNVAGVYDVLKWFSLPDGGFVYPNGQDWHLFRNPDTLYEHVMMAVVAHDPDSAHLCDTALSTLEKMQQRYSTGRVYHAEECSTAPVPPDLMRKLALSWLFLSTSNTIADAPRPRVGLKELKDGKILLQRTAATVISVSYGSRPMIMCLPLRDDRIVSPHRRSGIGAITLAGESEQLAISVDDAHIDCGANSFTAELIVNHGDGAFRADIHVSSDDKGDMLLSEKLTALRDVETSQIATGLIGVLNNRHWIFESGSRNVAFDGQTTAVPALSHKELTGDAVSDVSIDKVLAIHSDSPLYVRYVGAAGVDRGRATDRLYLNYLGGKRPWRAGDVVSEYRVRIRRADG